VAEARAEFERLAGDDFCRLQRDYTWLPATSLLAEVCHFLKDPIRAGVLYRHMLPYAERNTVMGYGIVCSGSAARGLGLLAATMGEWQEAERHFECALQANCRMRARPWVAWSQHDYARMLCERGQPGDGERAAGLLEQALRTARELGMSALAGTVARAGGGAAADQSD
jgi:hypothetical protein